MHGRMRMGLLPSYCDLQCSARETRVHDQDVSPGKMIGYPGFIQLSPSSCQILKSSAHAKHYLSLAFVQAKIRAAMSHAAIEPLNRSTFWCSAPHAAMHPCVPVPVSGAEPPRAVSSTYPAAL